MNADPRVMEFMPACLSPAESDAFADRIQAQFEQHGFGLYAAELREEHRFIGFIGLSVPNFDAHLMPCVEIGWRLAAAYWGRGCMIHNPSGDFEHPKLPQGHPLRRHVLYRLADE